jgi:hypothetical protein
MQYILLEYNNNNNNIKHSEMVLRSNGMPLRHLKRNRDAIPPHPTPPQFLDIYNIYIYKIGCMYVCLIEDWDK